MIKKTKLIIEKLNAQAKKVFQLTNCLILISYVINTD